MSYQAIVDGERWRFADLKTLLAKASPARAGDALAGVAAQSAIERVAAQMTLADLPLKTFLDVDLVPYEEDEISRLIHDSHDPIAFSAVAARWRVQLRSRRWRAIGRILRHCSIT